MEIWNLEFLKIQKMQFFTSFCILTMDVFLGFLLVLDLGKMTEPIFWAKAAITRRFEPFQNRRSKMDVLGPFSTLYEKMVLIRLETPKTKLFLLEPSPGSFSGKNERFPKTVIFSLNPAKFLESAKTAPKWAGNRPEMPVIWFFTRKLSYQTISRLSPEKGYHKSVKS